MVESLCSYSNKIMSGHFKESIILQAVTREPQSESESFLMVCIKLSIILGSLQVNFDGN